MHESVVTPGHFLGALGPGGEEPYLVVFDGARPRWALPTVTPKVLRASLSVYTPGTLRGTAAWHAARLVTRAGFGTLLPGRRMWAHSWIARPLSEVVGLRDVHLAAASSYDGRRCAIAIVDDAGLLRGFAKVAAAADAMAVARLHKEAEVLERLSGKVGTIEVPRVMHLGRLGDLEALVLTPVRGNPAMHPFRLTRRRTEAAAEIFSLRGPTTTLGERLDLAVDDPGWSRRLEAVRTACAGVAAVSVPTGLVHGDFAAWNMLEDGRRVAGLVDWEQARFDGLPLWDLWHFAVQAAGPGRSRRALEAIRRAVHGEGSLAAEMAWFAHRSGLPPGLAAAALLLYLVTTGIDWLEQARAGMEDVHRGLQFRARLLDELLLEVG